ncbi:acyl-CoA dehydrogenase family protein [Paraburkholderia sp. EG286B]|uniref:acyl-CoA dehydrogenase family protein n=1 Tax=Paraburkholderia sp. EG286B TaxID=3237011 RepID=UPI0034D24F50
MIHPLTPEQQEIRNAILKLCGRFGDDYWLARDADGEFPWEFRQALADAGFLGISLPETYGGGGLGLTEGMLMMQAIAESGAGFSGGTAVGFGVWAPRILVNFASEEQKARWLPPIIRGEILSSFSVTEPDAGLDTTNISTFARRDGDRYIVNGRKAWCSVAQRASKILLLTRTSPRDPDNPTEGMTLFYTDLDRNRIEVREIQKMGRKCVDSNLLFIDDLEVPVEDRVGEEGKAFRYLLMGLNPERIMMAGQAVGLGRAALAKATQYARDRVVFGRPIGQNQAIQHPLAVNWMQLEAAQLMTLRAAALYDAGQSCGAEANAAKYLAAEAGFEACTRAILIHGGMGYAKEYHVERYLREVMIPRIAPVSAEMVKNFIAEKVLDLPKSY